MSYIFLTIVIVLVIIIGIYQLIKRYYLRALIKGLNQKNYEKVISISLESLTNKVLTEYLCDLFRIRAYKDKKDTEGFKNELDKALDKHYPLNKRKEFLELYFHQFTLIQKEQEYATKFLSAIEELGDSKFSKYNRQAYEVIFNKRTDLLDEMIEEIETDKYYGVALGVVVYIIGVQYLYLGDKENARTYFYNSLTCFNKKSMYVAKINKEMDALTNQLGEEKFDY